MVGSRAQAPFQQVLYMTSTTAMTACLPAPPPLQTRSSPTSIVEITVQFSRTYPSRRDEIRRQRIELEQRRRDELRDSYRRLKDALPVANQKSGKVSFGNVPPPTSGTCRWPSSGTRRGSGKQRTRLPAFVSAFISPTIIDRSTHVIHVALTRRRCWALLSNVMQPPPPPWLPFKAVACLIFLSCPLTTL
jgi:hypothetical protein